MANPLTPEQIARAGTEHAHQVAVFVWAALQYSKYPELRLMFAIPNGGLRNKITAANLKAEGVKSGVPDIFLPVPRGCWLGLFIEMKKPGGHVEKEQTKWMSDLRAQGYGAVVCVGWENAVIVLQQYLDWR